MSLQRRQQARLRQVPWSDIRKVVGARRQQSAELWLLRWERGPRRKGDGLKERVLRKSERTRHRTWLLHWQWRAEGEQ